MKTKVLYRYLGTNGLIDSFVHLEDVYYVRMLEITPEEGMVLTNGKYITHMARIPEEELDQWQEIQDEAEDNQE